MATGGKIETISNLRKVGTLTLKPDDLDPRGVVVVGDKLVITDFMSDKVHVYRRHDGTLLSSSDQLTSEPCGVCRVSDTEFCVVMGDASIAIMAVKISGQISRVKTFRLRPTFDRCYGVGLWKDTIVVSGVKDGMICWSVVSSQDGGPEELHKVCGGSYFSHLTVKHDMLYVTCGADSPDDPGVYGFNLLSPRQPPYTYKPGGITLGITVDDIGHLFVCVWFSSIHHLTATCQLVAIYEDDVPRDPLAIFWDSGVLYLASVRSHVITMYETPQQGTAIAAKAKIKVDMKDQNEKSQQVFGETKALEQDIVSQKGNVSRVKLKARISPLTPVNIVDPVEPVTQRLSEAGIHGSLLRQLSKDLICEEWRFFFRELSVADEDIKRIEFDNRHSGLREQIYQLLHFSNKKGLLNKTNMMKALESIDRVDLVTKYTHKTFPDS